MTEEPSPASRLYAARRALVFGILLVILGTVGLVNDPTPYNLIHVATLIAGAAALGYAARYYYLRNLTRKGIPE